jgi:replicative DNA helicase
MAMTSKPKKDRVKIPPQNKEAEQTVLGCLLIDKNAIIKVVDVLEAGDFYVPAHEKIYASIRTLFESSSPIDILSLSNFLKQSGELNEVGGTSYLAELTNQVTTASHVAHYAKLVKEKKVLRDLIDASAEITETAFEPSQEIEVMLDSIEQKIMSISQKSLPKNFIAVKDELKAAYERIERLHEHKGTLRGVPTGFTGVDNKLSGLQKSDLVILGARPSLGEEIEKRRLARQAAS